MIYYGTNSKKEGDYYEKINENDVTDGGWCNGCIPKCVWWKHH